jgi:NET1-associated nuclear protein 1 (U3 small nucleolar RNA-associated protein 17)
VIPDITRTVKSTEVHTPLAFVSVEDTSKPADQKKALRGQVRIYDLTKGRQVGCLLAEVRFSDLSHTPPCPDDNLHTSYNS